MKTKIAVALLFAALLYAAPRSAEASVSVSISFFHDELAPYGRWVSTPAYGEIWYPTVVRSGWAPYVDGEWVYSDCGWTWVSYDPFSDPFHYGTWVWVDPYGWSWVPGYVWGPAWVTWAWTDSYVGWAPVPPTFAITAGGYSGGPVTVAQTQYVFVPAARFVGTNISTVRIAAAQNPTILGHAQRTTAYSVSGGFVRTSGPPATLVQHATGRSLQAVKVSSLKVRSAPISTAASHGGRLSIVAPASERRTAALKQSRTVKPAPSMVVRHDTQNARAASRHATTSGNVHKGKETAHVSRTDRYAPPGPPPQKHEARPAHAAEKSHGGPPPARTVEKKHEAPPQQSKIREDHRAAVNRPPEQPHPARAQAPAPAPRVEQPHPAPPPQAARAPQQHQPQGQGHGQKKEK